MKVIISPRVRPDSVCGIYHVDKGSRKKNIRGETVCLHVEVREMTGRQDRMSLTGTASGGAAPHCQMGPICVLESGQSGNSRVWSGKQRE